MGDSSKVKRDALGRFQKGSSGNRKGRPKTEKENFSNPVLFRSGFMDITYKGKRMLVTRREALILKLYQAALERDVRALIYLDRKWHEIDKIIAHNLGELEEMEAAQRTGKISDETRRRIEALREFADIYGDKMLA